MDRHLVVDPPTFSEDILPLITPSQTAYAGLYGPISLCAGTPYLSPLAGTVVTVYESDGSTVPTLYTDETKSTPAASNQVTADLYGRIFFYANPGLYVLSFSVGGSTTTQNVTVQPWYADAAWNVVVDTTSEVCASGDSRLVNAGGGAISTTACSPTLAARVRVEKTDSSANAVTVTAPSGVILGVGLGNGVSTLPLGTQGAFVELLGDGTNFHIVGGERDTGWQAITTFNSGESSAGSPTPQYRIVGDRVWCRGAVNINSTISPTGMICALPVVPPANVQGFSTVVAAGTSTVLIVNTAGQISVPSGFVTLTSGQVVELDTITFTLQ